MAFAAPHPCARRAPNYGMLSVAATRRTLERIEALFDGHLPSPAELLAVDPNSLRQAGLSWRKIGTLRDLAERLSDGRLDVNTLSTLPDDDFIAALTAISGIGPWTAQGALLIALQRDDARRRSVSRSRTTTNSHGWRLPALPNHRAPGAAALSDLSSDRRVQWRGL